MQESKITKPTDMPPISDRRIFLMGNGVPVRPKRSREFCDAVVERCLDGKFHDHEFFALGFAACFDAVARGTIDLEEHPVNVVTQAWADINNITTAPNKVTDIMKVEGGGR